MTYLELGKQTYIDGVSSETLLIEVWGNGYRYISPTSHLTHRLDGPAIILLMQEEEDRTTIFSEPKEQYYIDGVEFNKKDFDRQVKLIIFK